MELRIEDGLLIAKVVIEYQGKSLTLDNVLVDTGCSDSIFDTDLLAEVGLFIDYVNGMPTTMYGIGGEGEICNQQLVNELWIGNRVLNQFPLQLGVTRDSYGFDGFIGLDFDGNEYGPLDFSVLEVSYKS